MTPRAAATRAPATVAPPARRPVGPRRISGPARRPAPASPVLTPLRRVVDHPFLDRLIRGRTWIGIVAFALIGIVGMQVALLKLNAGIGSSVQHAAALAAENALLSEQVSTLRASDLRAASAGHQGMVYAPAGDVRYLSAGPSDAAGAAASIVPPMILGGQTTTGGGQAGAPSNTSTSTSTSTSSGSGNGAGG